MDYLKLVSERYSCKRYSEKAVEKEKLDRILEAGRLSLTAKNLQEQRVYVLQSDKALAQMDSLTPCRYGAPVVLMVAYDKNNVYTYPGNTRDSGIEDASIVATHMLLAAKAEGVDSCWVNFVDPDKAAEVFELPENEEFLMFLDLGYPAEEGGEPLPNHFSRKAIEETVTYL